MQTVKLLIKYKVDVNVADNVSIVFKFPYGEYPVDVLSYSMFMSSSFRKGGLHCILPSKAEIDL
jgi:hypothetical protein